jgi:hypothetical protein
MGTLSVEEVDILKDFHHISVNGLIPVNGLPEPRTQYVSVPDYLRDGPCATLDPKGTVRIFIVFLYKFLTIHVGVCIALPRYRLARTSSSAAMTPDADSAESQQDVLQLPSPLMNLGLNPYDLRKKVRSVLFTPSLLHARSLTIAHLG